jgi:hypothetical protein
MGLTALLSEAIVLSVVAGMMPPDPSGFPALGVF